MSEIPGDLKFLKSHEWARVEDDGTLHLSGVVLRADGGERLFVHHIGDVDEAEELGRTAAEELLSLGAARLIADSRGTGGHTAPQA